MFCSLPPHTRGCYRVAEGSSSRDPGARNRPVITDYGFGLAYGVRGVRHPLSLQVSASLYLLELMVFLYRPIAQKCGILLLLYGQFFVATTT